MKSRIVYELMPGCTTESESRSGPSRLYSVSLLHVDFFFLNFLQLYCPNGIYPMGNSGCFPRGKPAATESRYPTDLSGLSLLDLWLHPTSVCMCGQKSGTKTRGPVT